MQKEHSCGVVLLSSERPPKVLLLNYPQGHWDFPKGHVEGTETPHETAKRELEEETGITEIEFLEGFEESYSYQYTFKEKQAEKHVTLFLAKTEEKEVRLSHEHRGFEWVDISKAEEKVTFEHPKRIVKKAKEMWENYLS